MLPECRTNAELEAENRELRRRLDEAEEILEAIRRDRVDAIIVQKPEGDQVYIFSDADRPYRAMIEEMQDGAMALREDGLVLFGNRRIAAMLGVSPDYLRGAPFSRYVAPGSQAAFQTIFEGDDHGKGQGEVLLLAADGALIPVLLRATRISLEQGALVSVVASDLTHWKHYQELAAVFDALHDPIVVFDALGNPVRANGAARAVLDFDLGVDGAAYLEQLAKRQVQRPDGRRVPSTEVPSRRALQGEFVRGEEFFLTGVDGRALAFEVTAMPLHNDANRIVGAVTVWHDISVRKQAEEGLAAAIASAEQARAAAETANVAKSQFLANMSHELRTPMNAILGMIDVALPKAIDPMVKDCLQTAKGSADLLLTLLNDLLDSAKIESGKLELESLPFSLRRMLDQITRVLSVRASEKGLYFFFRMPEEIPDAVVGDRTRLQQVLLNLAGNAIKFTERGEVEIGLSVWSKDEEAILEFTVRDTGIGISPLKLADIFEPFAQADASTSRRFGGTGLGLSICRNLVEMMGGRLWVDSEVGKGSVFHFTARLPLSKELPRDPVAPILLPAAVVSLRVLLAEDNPANQKLATYILRDRGHLVEIAGSGDEAVRLVSQRDYDVILMDVEMPGMNGLEATAEIRRQERGRRTPIIAMTAHAMRGDRERCLAAGMDGYLAKPISAPQMIGLVENLARASAPDARCDSASSLSMASPSPSARVVFDHDEAIAKCADDPEVLLEMIQCFFDEVDNLFPQMHVALEKGNLVEVGRLGHRMKGTVVYLGAQPAQEAALRVERFERHSGELSEAEDAVRALEQACESLRASLVAYQSATGLAKNMEID